MRYVTRLLRVLVVSCLANYLLVFTQLVPLSGLSAGVVLLALLVGYLTIHIRPCRAPGVRRRLRTLLGGYELLMVVLWSIVATGVAVAGALPHRTIGWPHAGIARMGAGCD